MNTSKKDIRSITELVKKNHTKLVRDHKVKKFGVGLKSMDGRITDEISLIVYVRSKQILSTLRQNNIVPIPKEIEGVKTDVVELPLGINQRVLRLLETVAAPDDGRYRPISGGEAMIMAGIPATGTLGVVIESDGELYGITNNHVGANEDIEGQSSTAKEGNDWIHPGAHGGGRDPQDAFAKLFKWNRIKPQASGQENYYDFSMGRVTTTKDVLPYEIKEIGKVEGVEDIEVGDIVMKYGRTTRKTVGRVLATGVGNLDIGYGEQPIMCDFADQVDIVGRDITEPFSLAGDSGSLIVSTDTAPYKAKALLFAGGPDGHNIDHTFASPFKRISRDFNLNV
jgi:hypothetical protein